MTTTQHPLNEGCFFCATDAELLSGIRGHDLGHPWTGRTLHMQVPESFCPHANQDASDDHPVIHIAAPQEPQGGTSTPRTVPRDPQAASGELRADSISSTSDPRTDPIGTIRQHDDRTAVKIAMGDDTGKGGHVWWGMTPDLQARAYHHADVSAWNFPRTPAPDELIDQAARVVHATRFTAVDNPTAVDEAIARALADAGLLADPEAMTAADALELARFAERDRQQAIRLGEMFTQCRRDYGRLVHALGCIEDDDTDDVLAAAQKLIADRDELRARRAAALAELTRVDKPMGVCVEAARTALTGDPAPVTPVDKITTSHGKTEDVVTDA